MKQSANHYLSNPFLYRLVSSILILSVLCKLLHTIRLSTSSGALSTYEFSEFLINFQGGFVRRGLLGEILFWFTSTTGINPQITISIICALFYIGVTWFFFVKFKERGYRWWLLLSPFMCGFVVYVIRKDFILYAVVIGMMYLIRDGSPALWKRIVALFLAALGLMLHEAFMFWGIPIFALVLLTDREHLTTNVIFILLLVGIFGAECIFKGNIDTANAINESWNSVSNSNLHLVHHNSIGALTWGTLETFIFHIKNNLGAQLQGIMYWPLLTVLIYYLISFFFTSFPPIKGSYDKDEQSRLSCIMIILLICLLPMFTLLSCDYGRLFQYVVITAFAAIIILDVKTIDRIIPDKINKSVASFNLSLSNYLPPSKLIIIILLLTIGVSPFHFNPTSSLIQSPLGSILYFCSQVVDKLFPTL